MTGATTSRVQYGEMAAKNGVHKTKSSSRGPKASSTAKRLVKCGRAQAHHSKDTVAATSSTAENDTDADSDMEDVFETTSALIAAKASAATKANSSSPLLQLPGEIRNQIYDYVMSDQKMLINDSGQIDNPPALLQTCRQLYSEAHMLAYTESTFVVTQTPHIEYLLERLSENKRDAISSIEIPSRGSFLGAYIIWSNWGDRFGQHEGWVLSDWGFSPTLFELGLRGFARMIGLKRVHLQSTKVPARYADEFPSDTEKALKEIKKEMKKINAKVEVTATFV